MLGAVRGALQPGTFLGLLASVALGQLISLLDTFSSLFVKLLSNEAAYQFPILQYIIVYVGICVVAIVLYCNHWWRVLRHTAVAATPLSFELQQFCSVGSSQFTTLPPAGSNTPHSYNHDVCQPSPPNKLAQTSFTQAKLLKQHLYTGNAVKRDDELIHRHHCSDSCYDENSKGTDDEESPFVNSVGSRIQFCDGNDEDGGATEGDQTITQHIKKKTTTMDVQRHAKGCDIEDSRWSTMTMVTANRHRQRGPSSRVSAHRVLSCPESSRWNTHNPRSSRITKALQVSADLERGNFPSTPPSPEAMSFHERSCGSPRTPSTSSSPPTWERMTTLQHNGALSSPCRQSIQFQRIQQLHSGCYSPRDSYKPPFLSTTMPLFPQSDATSATPCQKTDGIQQEEDGIQCPPQQTSLKPYSPKSFRSPFEYCSRDRATYQESALQHHVPSLLLPLSSLQHQQRGHGAADASVVVKQYNANAIDPTAVNDIERAASPLPDVSLCVSYPLKNRCHKTVPHDESGSTSCCEEDSFEGSFDEASSHLEELSCQDHHNLLTKKREQLFSPSQPPSIASNDTHNTSCRHSYYHRYRKVRRTLWKIFTPGTWGFYALLAFIDVQGGTISVMAFNHANLASSCLIDWVSLLTGFALSVKFMQERITRYRILALLIGLAGSLCILISDTSLHFNVLAEGSATLRVLTANSFSSSSLHDVADTTTLFVLPESALNSTAVVRHASSRFGLDETDITSTGSPTTTIGGRSGQSATSGCRRSVDKPPRLRFLHPFFDSPTAVASDTPLLSTRSTEHSSVGGTLLSNKFFGDLLCVVSAIFLGTVTVMLEKLLSMGISIREVLLKTFGLSLAIALLEFCAFELQYIQHLGTFSSVAWAYFVGAGLSMTAVYCLAPVILERSSSAFFNLSLLTSAGLSVLLSALVLGDNFPALYSIGLVLILGSLMIYYQEKYE